MDNWLTDITNWLISLVIAFFTALLNFVHDAAVWVFDGVVSAVCALIAAIPAPSFLGSYSFIGLLNQLPAYPLYVLGQLEIGTALGIVLSGVVFRLARKLATLGQW